MPFLIYIKRPTDKLSFVDVDELLSRFRWLD